MGDCVFFLFRLFVCFWGEGGMSSVVLHPSVKLIDTWSIGMFVFLGWGWGVGEINFCFPLLFPYIPLSDQFMYGTIVVVSFFHGGGSGGAFSVSPSVSWFKWISCWLLDGSLDCWNLARLGPGLTASFKFKIYQEHFDNKTFQQLQPKTELANNKKKQFPIPDSIPHLPTPKQWYDGQLTGQKNPSGHSVQSVAPSFVLYHPAGQVRQSSDEFFSL